MNPIAEPTSMGYDDTLDIEKIIDDFERSLPKERPMRRERDESSYAAAHRSKDAQPWRRHRARATQ